MISLPDCPELIAELSLPLAERTETGKIKLESKDRMRARGVKSPDYADALALAFHAEPGFDIKDSVNGLFVFGLGDLPNARPAWTRA